MSRILFTSWPLYGHVLPKLAVAAALRERGHEVAFYTGSQARAARRGRGLRGLRFERVDEAAILGAVRELEERAGMGRPSLADVRRCFDAALLEPIPGQVADVGADRARLAAGGDRVRPHVEGDLVAALAQRRHHGQARQHVAVERPGGEQDPGHRTASRSGSSDGSTSRSSRRSWPP